MTNFRILTDTVSIMMESAQPMSCSVGNSFEAENNAAIDNASVSTINANFELSSEDISLVSYIFQAIFQPLVPCYFHVASSRIDSCVKPIKPVLDNDE